MAKSYLRARSTTRQVGAVLAQDRKLFEVEKLSYKTDEEGDDLMQDHLRHLRKL
jgi:hypothetical protein